MSDNEETLTVDVYSSKDDAKSDTEGDDNQENVELLVNTRAKRSTAGNRLYTLLQQEEPDDELELLFAEDEQDTGFFEVEADQSDVEIGSSTDEEDQEPDAEDNLEGERELQKNIKSARIKDKKKKSGMSKILKKARINAALHHQTPHMIKKKSERISWLPTTGDAPVRQSSRRTTRQSKQELHVHMMDREIKRLRQLAKIEKTAAAKAAKKTPPLTQEDRLKEASRVEKANAKSLNRWERAEREREEEQRLRLANLHSRHLEGPVLTFWSGMATYVDGKLQKIGNLEIVPKEKPVIKRRKMTVTEENEKKDDKEKTKENLELEITSSNVKDETSTNTYKNSDEKATATISEPKIQYPTHETVVKASDQTASQLFVPSSSSCLAPPAGLPLIAPPHPFLSPLFNRSLHLSGIGFYPHHPNYLKSLSSQNHTQFHEPHQIPPASPALPITETCLRSSLIFTNFSETAIKNRETTLKILFPHYQHSNIRSNPHSVKPARARGTNRGPFCVITGNSAKYRDPKTGLYYSNLYAYKQLQKLQRGEILWSDLVGCFVGSGALDAAKGVPDRFKVERKGNL